ncbi:ORF22 [Aviadenovirus cerasi]|uniref:ORF22 n=1 Tax=Fowl aviadenovirus 5 TaxID=172861 RepID=A0A6M3Z580_9ADEN|nr:ORF22 [Fowl aviadenovirus 5]
MAEDRLRLWERDEDEREGEGVAGPNGVPRVPAVHAYQFLCLEDFEMIPLQCHCHGFELRRVPGAVYGQTRNSELALYLWCRLEGYQALEGVYFVAAWAATMFTEFKPVFCDVPARGVLGMIIYVPPKKTDRFVKAIATLGEMGALPCHYIRRMKVDFANHRVLLFSEQWHAEAVNCLYYWQNGQWDDLCQAREQTG